ncbi:MAG: hypothetical protein ACI9XO_004222 [Paraglaciecola sp.]|jgi:hypothetical protein
MLSVQQARHPQLCTETKQSLARAWSFFNWKNTYRHSEGNTAGCIVTAGLTTHNITHE